MAADEAREAEANAWSKGFTLGADEDEAAFKVKLAAMARQKVKDESDPPKDK